MKPAVKIDHVAIAVRDIDRALDGYRQILGLEPASRELVASQKTEAALLPLGESNLELICPQGNAGLERFLAERGPGLHHVAIEVRDLARLLERLQSQGVPLIDKSPRPGARGHQVAFVHPKATGGVLLELVEP